MDDEEEARKGSEGRAPIDAACQEKAGRTKRVASKLFRSARTEPAWEERSVHQGFQIKSKHINS